ncbi:hypothetical protein B0I35DRAFT_362109 [Stachybotrys elegans]|uniref:Carrier domain-containing protein n=1 Tax=Stachybotrys elegans TaxID=80388 RepID=A0A8K0SE73_9HYPO|nr:hypothetical protein B0I35DRAFT_362109 [Stachybotrys elegans]
MPPFSEEANIPIAIVGLSCRFPGDASTPSKFWDLLKNGRDGFSQTTTRYNAEAFCHPTGHGNRQNIIPTKGGYFLKEDPYLFDAAFFNITAAEAVALDPRQRIAMEVAYEALENAGFTLQKIAGTQTACFMGSSMSDYRDGVARDFAHAPKYHILGISDEMIANRISHFLDIHGPSATVQTACSSSLVATHIACQSIRSGESDMALAGGVGLMVSTDGTMHLNNLGFLNPEGHSRSFDEKANGYGRGEGCGVVVLKRLDRAIRDGDTIRAVIRASGANSDGWTQGVTMPSGDAQANLIKYVYESNGLDYGATQYVEAHGTGTKAGDPIETGAIYRTIGRGGAKSSRKKLWVGSVKPNIGHLEAAAGVASIIKGVLALEHGLIPPNIRFTKANPSIPLDEWNMAVPTAPTPWPAVQTKRMSVSGFGMGGTNAHIVLEAVSNPAAISYSTNGVVACEEGTKRLFVFSSHDKAGFKRLGKTLADHIGDLGPAASSPEYLANLAHTLAKARSGLLWRSACFADGVISLHEQLTTTLGEDAARAPSGSATPRIGFVFTGQGAQWAGMGVEMLGRRVFGESVAKSAEYLREMGCDWDPVAELSKGAKESRLGVPAISQPICSVLQIALIDELRSWGVTPAKVVGHSSGEIAAAYSIGALSHRDAIAVAYFRGQTSTGRPGGGMMAVGCSREDAHKLMQETNLHVTVACVNSPSNVTLSGDVTTLEALREILAERGVFARRLKVEVAYHSPHMNEGSVNYFSAIEDLDWDLEVPGGESQPVMISSVTGFAADPEELGPFYWVRNLTSPVLFTDAVRELARPAAGSQDAKDIDLLIEVGPHSALGGPIEQILGHYGISNVAYMSMLTRGQSALDTSLNLAADLFRHGVPIDVAKVNGDSNTHLLTNLPPYAWNHSEKFRADSRLQREFVNQQFPTRSLIGAQMPKMEETESVWRGFIRLDDEPWLRDHTVGTTVVFPAAGMVSMVLEAVQQVADQGKTPRAFRMRDVSFLAAMSLPDKIATEVTIHMRPHLLGTSGSTPSAWWEFTVSSVAGPVGQMRNNCRGLVSIVYEQNRSPQMICEEASLEAGHIADHYRILRECPETCPKDVFYDRMAKSALPYGPLFQGVETCHPGSGKTAFDVKLVDIGETFTKGKLERPFLIHAAALDAIFQGWLGSTSKGANSSDFGLGAPMLPASMAEFEIAADIPGDVGYVMPGHCFSHRHGFKEFSADIHMLTDDLSKVLLSVTDFRTSEVEIEESSNANEGALDVDPAEITAEVHWNYALDIMNSSEISQAVAASATTTYDKLIELVRMVIHQQPTLNVIELTESIQELSQAVIPTLPGGMLLPSQVRYGLVNGNGDKEIEGDVFGHVFDLSILDSTNPADIASADLFVIPHHVSRNLKTKFDGILERLIALAKPGAFFIIGDNETIAAPVLKAKGFQRIISIPSVTGSLAMYSLPQEQQDKTSTITDITILKPSTSSIDAQLFSKKLQSTLREQGISVSVETVSTSLRPASVEGKTYVSLLELEQPLLENISESDYQSIQALMLNCERLLWITRGNSPSLKLIDGLARCINNETAGNKVQVLHLDRQENQVSPSLAARVLLSSRSSAMTDCEFRERAGLIQIPRIFRSMAENERVRNHLEDSTRVMGLRNGDEDPLSTPYRLTIGKPGLLDSLHFVADDTTITAPLGDDELELEIKASGVNFRDIMASMGLVPVRGLGQEASGVVLRAGSRAAACFKPGDRVSTLCPGGLHATRTRCDYHATVRIPDAMSFEEAAASPMAHATAYYALVKLAKLRAGQSVLIHAAAGGVGQAAVQLAKYLDLVAYVTVGTDDKRRFMVEQYGIPEDHIFNSRDASFVKGIHRVTGGRGVDCVLNSLSGELLRVSFGCLATFGTFVEIGLRDITDNMRLDMRPFSKSTTFTFLNLQNLLEQDPAVLGETLSETFKLLQQDILHTPYPMTVYPVSQVEEVFRIMQQGKHRGKLVLSFCGDKVEAPVLCKAKDSLKLDPKGTYLLVGGLGGLGRSLAIEFIRSGCRNLAFISRSGDSKPAAKAVVEELRSMGAVVKVFRGDVADEPSFLSSMAQITQQLPPVKGVVQMAMVLRDTVFENMTHGEWMTPLQPKVAGTWNLHKYFGHDRPLDFMIFCSSISGVTGNPGQAQYDAGNTYQDALAHYRRDQGLKAVSVNLGIMLDVGVIAETGAHNFKVWEEVLGIREPAFHALMRSLINGQKQRDAACPAQVCTGLGAGDVLATHNLPSPPWFKDSRFASLTVTSAANAANAGGDASSTATLASRLTEAGNNKDMAAATTIITGALVKKTAEILRIPPSEVDPSRPIYHYGVDSLVALEVRNWITREMKANVALLEILAAVPMETLAAQIAQKSKLMGDVA